MINLNLLSYEKRREIEIKRGTRLVMFFATVALFIFTVAVTLILANVGLAKKISDMGVTGRSGELLERARNLNEKVIIMEKLQGKFIFFSDSILDFGENVTSGIQIENLVFDKAGQSLTANGVASTREDLINFKKNLETVGRFSEVEISTEDISSKELVSFELRASVNFSKL